MGFKDYSDIVIFRAENGWTASINSRMGDAHKNFVAHSLQHLGEILAQALEPQNEIFHPDHLSPEDRERLMWMLKGEISPQTIRAPE